ncbi:MAG: hypothetical protein A49_23860 [Methyloceanibacter sp.]|nr:MAG: hypothetical protein A49_23860 [Methyloceanibacter sp.]
MTQVATETRRPRAASESLVVEKVDEGYRVHSPANRNRLYLVTGAEDEPACTCAEFRAHLGETGWRCPHIQAVERLTGVAEPTAPEPVGERHEPEPAPLTGNGREPGMEPSPTQMLLKRSVSPDRRIDSFSIEFSCSIAPGTAPEIVSQRARHILSVQSGIASHFLGAVAAARPEKRESAAAPTNGDTLPATMLEISGGKDGRSLFIIFEVDGETMRMFGKKEDLAEAIAAAGYPEQSRYIRKGKALDLPCSVVTEPSKDGRYTNVVEVFPPEDGGNGHGKSGRR